MTVSEIGVNKLRITLTDTEVLGCFGAYERLYTMSEHIKTVINALLRDIIQEHDKFPKNGKIVAEIKACKNSGCEIILTCISTRRHIKMKEYTIEFSDTESLTGGILMLYRQRQSRLLKSSLYKIQSRYRLIIKSTKDAEYFFMLNEYCTDISSSPYKAEHTKEHGRQLISEDAIKIYGKAFFKETLSS